MNVVVIGLGIQGKKRLAVAGTEVTATVDPLVPNADFRTIEEVPLDRYQAALVCTPDQKKIPILEFLLRHGKHVLVEKPLIADRSEDLKRLLAIAKASRASCLTAYNHRFEPNLARLRDVLASGTIGKVYQARFFYGNGTAADVKKSPWRDQGMGVIPDLGSHLLDLTDFLFGARPNNIRIWASHCFENRAFDHVVLGTEGDAAASIPALQYEMTLLSWRNTFSADVIGELGSAHVECLCKWGPSRLTVRRRIFPSGRPTEDVQVVEGPDPTWELEYHDFKRQCASGRTDLDKDQWINTVLQELQAQRKDKAWAA